MTSPATPGSQDPVESTAAEFDGAAATEAAAAALEELGPRAMPASQPVFMRAMRWSILLSVLLIGAFAWIGWSVAGQPGLVGGVIGTGIGGVMVILTVGSIAFANRFIASPAYLGIFFGTVMGGWLVKFIAFIVVMVLLRDRDWLDGKVLFFGLLASILLSLVLDAIIAMKARIPLQVSGI